MKVLVLGASGFIGGAVARRLLERGDRVTVLLRDASRHGDLPAAQAWRGLGAEIAGGSLGDPHSIAAAAEGVERVVHAAGIVSPRAAPRALRWTHVAGTENVVNACAHAGVGRLVFVSCADVTLVNTDRVHWDERRSLSQPPFGERARSLALAEEIALAGAGPELEVVALRPAWVWGPGDTSRLPHLCREALSQGGLSVLGGEPFLAAIYIDNLVRAILAALEAPDVTASAFHLADPEVLHARELFRLWSEAVGLPAPRSGPPLWMAWPQLTMTGRWRGLTPDEVVQRARSTLFDVNAAIGKLGFDPEVRVEDGMRALAEWVRARGGPEALAARAKDPPDARSVDAQVAAAGGD